MPSLEKYWLKEEVILWGMERQEKDSKEAAIAHTIEGHWVLLAQ